MEPKVFVSHASEDKQRFVVEFVRRLRENGVDAWHDQWEMHPGDSLVDKIFEQGLGSAQAIVIVLSAVSVHKPWVSEELNVSVVKKITRGLKVIPVAIDSCDIPQSLQTTLWQRIEDLNDYQAAFQNILTAIVDLSGRPARSESPLRVAPVECKLPALTQTDERVFREVGRHEIDLLEGFVTSDRLCEELNLAGIAAAQINDSLQNLAQQQLLMLDAATPASWYARLTLSGFRQYAEAFLDDYKNAVAQISALLVNEGVQHNHELAKRTGKSLMFINFVLDILDDADQIVVGKYGGGLWEVIKVLPGLKRALIAQHPSPWVEFSMLPGQRT